MNTKFSVDICVVDGYEKKVARLSYEGQLLLIISQDQGIEDMQIEVCFSDRSKTSYIFRLDDFVQALLSAKQQLIEASYS